MKLADRLYKTTEQLWNSYLEHPFVSGIADGSLDLDKFRFYMIKINVVIVLHVLIHVNNMQFH